jgi:hypothetical protein
MATTQHCGDPNPHGPHIYYGPGSGKKQEQYYCPGTSEKEK